MIKKDEINDALYTTLSSTGGQPARLLGLVKFHKEGTPLRPVRDLRGSSYNHLESQFFFVKVEEENIETNKQLASGVLEKTVLDSDESIVSLEVKSL